MRNMKWSILLLMALFCCTAVDAAPAKPGLKRIITLADGTSVEACLVGDEHGHYWLGTDGQAYRKLSDAGYFIAIDRQNANKKAKVRRQKANVKRMRRLPHRGMTISDEGYFGKKKGLIILVNFSSTSFATENNNALYQRIANEENFNEGDFKGSMHDYFLAQSLGQFELDFDVVGPVTVSHNYSYYGQNDSDDNDMRPGTMVTEAVNKAKSLVTDWTQYDWNGDGEIDQVYLVYAGYGEADTEGMENTIWPHAWTLTDCADYFGGNGPVSVGNGLYVDTYACGPELDGYTGEVAGLGTMCHEFSHCLGYPDYYDTDYSGGQGMSDWDLMDHGCYNGDSYQPAGYTSHERWVVGWLTPTELNSENLTVTNMKALQEGGESYIIFNKGNQNEYFLLENRQLTGWDASLPAPGLLILHVDYDEYSWENNTPNDDPEHQRMTWIPADNKYQYETFKGVKYYSWEGQMTDPFPYGKKNAFNKATSPAAKFYNKNSDGTYFMDSSIESITQNIDGTIAFEFKAAYEEGGQVTPPIEGALFYESFDQCSGTGGNDGGWSGQVASAEFQPDNVGWIAADDKAYGGAECAKFGSSKVNGAATTPVFTINGQGKLTFRAGAWNANNDDTTLKLSVSNGTVSPATVTMEKGEFTDFEATITATGNVSLTFESPKGRFFLDEVLITDPNVTAIETISQLPVLDRRIYFIDGRYAGNDISKLGRGLYIINGKKVVK